MNKEVSNKLELKGYVWTDGWLVGRTFWLWPHAVNFNDNDDNDEAWCFMQAIVSFSRPLFSSTLSKLVHSRSGNDLLRLKYVVDNNFRNSVVLSWSSFCFFFALVTTIYCGDSVSWVVHSFNYIYEKELKCNVFFWAENGIFF